MVAERDFIMGAFIWTGFDYRGEPCPLQRWPNINSNFGIIDLCGFPKDTWWYYRAWWSDQPSIHLLPHWDWTGLELQLAVFLGPPSPNSGLADRCFWNVDAE